MSDKPPSIPLRKVELSRERKLLVIGVKGLAEQVAHSMKRRLKLPQPIPELVKHALWGIALAAQSHDPERGAFREWAKLKAAMAILEGTRVEGREAAELQAARAAAFHYMHRVAELPPEAIAEAYDDENRHNLGVYKRRLLRLMLCDVAATRQSTGGEDEMIEKLDGIRVARIVLEGFEALRPELREVLRLLWEGDEEDPDAEPTCQRAAAKLGVTRFVVYERRDEAFKLLRARLAAKRITELPAGIDEIWAAVIKRREIETGGR